MATALLWWTWVGAAQDFDGSTGYAESSVVEVSVAPLSICCWFNTDDNAGSRTPMAISRSSTTDEVFALNNAGNLTGDPVRNLIQNGATGASAVSSTGFSTGTWHHGCATYASSSSRAAYIDGGSKGTNSTSVTPGTLNRTNIGGLYFGGSLIGHFDGRVAECGLWDRSLSDADVASLGKGFAPPCIRNGLIAYYPMIRDTSSLKDLFSGTANNLTLNGTNSVANHPRIINCQ